MTEQELKDRGRAIQEGKTVNRYLTILAEPVRRGRPRTQESIEAQIAEVETELENPETPLARLHLTQKLMDLQQALESGVHDRAERLQEAEMEFVKVAASYSERKNISYAAWRAVGVPAKVLKAAGISR